MPNSAIIDWSAWLKSPAGRYAFRWETTLVDQWVGDLFGYHALQLGNYELNTLRENRISCRTLVLNTSQSPKTSVEPSPNAPSYEPTPQSILVSHFHELPIATTSIDLVVLPHTLEFAENPHAILREVERILVPDGKVIITGFNNLSLWSAREKLGHLTGIPFLPPGADLIAFTRIKDWLKLLNFEIDRGRFGCYRPPLRGIGWLERFAFIEKIGDRWWPIFGALYAVRAVKRVHSMRLVGKIRKGILALQPATSSVHVSNTSHTTKPQNPLLKISEKC
ncbi:class I SAM-dependent methyltransferase [Candidatus Pandoraea novymonadis]|uniref:Methyltransferase type 11 domain-containing protein n=1 Tax=Candidatus Pandoraea novymonadis TaxID=1808959 RepID=A0ABX5FFR7_9BURK|nr:class I SAM-dependent methyltransferase [Candidatus Pandoraea novymonadis]PSB92191.1 hypothetical protein BZL35_00425 [Candidatus Pandoraea novymonadis]